MKKIYILSINILILHAYTIYAMKRNDESRKNSFDSPQFICSCFLDTLKKNPTQFLKKTSLETLKSIMKLALNKKGISEIFINEQFAANKEKLYIMQIF